MKNFCFILFALASCVPILHATESTQTISFERFLAILNEKTVNYKNVKKLPAPQEYALTKQNMSLTKGGVLANTTKSHARHTALPIASNCAITFTTDNELTTLQNIDWKTSTPADIFSSPNHVITELRNFIAESASFLSQQTIDDLPAFEDGFTEASRNIQCTRTVNFKSSQEQDIARATITCQRYEVLKPAPKNGFKILVDIQGVSSKKPTWTEPMFKRMLGIQASPKPENTITLKDYCLLTGFLMGVALIGSFIQTSIDSLKTH